MPPDRRPPRSVSARHKRQDGPWEGHPQTEADFTDLQILDGNRVAEIVLQFRAVDQAVAQPDASKPALIYTEAGAGIQHIAHFEAALGADGIGGLVEGDPVAQIGEQQPDPDKWTDDVVRQKGIDTGGGNGDDGRGGNLDADRFRIVADDGSRWAFEQDARQGETQAGLHAQVIGELIAQPAIQRKHPAVFGVIGLLSLGIAGRNRYRQTKSNGPDADPWNSDVLLLLVRRNRGLIGIFEVEFRGEQPAPHSHINLARLGARRLDWQGERRCEQRSSDWQCPFFAWVTGPCAC